MLFKAEIFLSMMDIGEEPLTIPEKSRKIAYECATCAQINQKLASIAKPQSKSRRAVACKAVLLLAVLRMRRAETAAT